MDEDPFFVYGPVVHQQRFRRPRGGGGVDVSNPRPSSCPFRGLSGPEMAGTQFGKEDTQVDESKIHLSRLMRRTPSSNSSRWQRWQTPLRGGLSVLESCQTLESRVESELIEEDIGD